MNDSTTARLARDGTGPSRAKSDCDGRHAPAEVNQGGSACDKYSERRATPDDAFRALRAYCRGFRAGVAAASDAEGRAYVSEARAVAVLRALGLASDDAAMILDVAREDAAAIFGADSDSYDVRCVAAQLVIDLVRVRLARLE
ncbi:MAG: hypothetical protein IT377_22645 [Polyangiaceae bacterium]|nr:hypothetical protein [Polyangiaceae bacterium]